MANFRVDERAWRSLLKKPDHSAYVLGRAFPVARHTRTSLAAKSRQARFGLHCPEVARAFVPFARLKQVGRNTLHL